MRNRRTGLLMAALFLAFGICRLIMAGQAQNPNAAFTPVIPKVWDDEALRAWALPLVGLGQPPTLVEKADWVLP